MLIDHDLIAAERLPGESAIAAVTLAELAAGRQATENKDERARRQDRLQWATATWDRLPFDDPRRFRPVPLHPLWRVFRGDAGASGVIVTSRLLLTEEV